MRQRKLDISEHSRTRALWEQVFAEDTKAFLDYYYFLKTRENEIYVIEEDGEICSMLHLNSYLLQVEQESFHANYIVGVATREEYRGRGYMRRILTQSMEEMYRRREWFTFLMPAAESIYTPYDFRYIYAQGQSVLRILEHTPIQDSKEISGAAEQVICEDTSLANAENVVTYTDASLPAVEEVVTYTDASLSDARELADFFAEQFAEKWQVYAVRDEQYYQRQIFEQQSENGGIRLLRANDRIVGSFLYSREGETEILEPLYLPEYERCFQEAVRELAKDGQKAVKIFGVCRAAETSNTNIGIDAGDLHPCEKKPVIMARLLHPECVLAAMRAKDGCTLNCSFAVLDTFLLQNNRIWRISSEEEDNGGVRVRETEDSEGVLPIAALTSLLFGSQTIAEIEKEDGVIMSPHLKEELAKLQPLERVLLNEIV